jgi:hypothetical protein
VQAQGRIKNTKSSPKKGFVLLKRPFSRATAIQSPNLFVTHQWSDNFSARKHHQYSYIQIDQKWATQNQPPADRGKTVPVVGKCKMNLYGRIDRYCLLMGLWVGGGTLLP